MIFKRIVGNFLRMSQEFFAKTCIVISALSARNYAEIYQNPKSLYPAGYCPSLLQAHLYMVLFDSDINDETGPNCDAAFLSLPIFERREKNVQE